MRPEKRQDASIIKARSIYFLRHPPVRKRLGNLRLVGGGGATLLPYKNAFGKMMKGSSGEIAYRTANRAVWPVQPYIVGHDKRCQVDGNPFDRRAGE